MIHNAATSSQSLHNPFPKQKLRIITLQDYSSEQVFPHLITQGTAATLNSRVNDETVFQCSTALEHHKGTTYRHTYMFVCVVYMYMCVCTYTYMYIQEMSC